MAHELPTLQPSTRTQVRGRLEKIEGQVRGIGKMVDDERYCVEILTQLAAAQQALRAAGKLVLRNYLETCATRAIREGRDEIYDELMDVVYKFAR